MELRLLISRQGEDESRRDEALLAVKMEERVPAGNAASRRKTEKIRKQILPWRLQKEPALPTPRF